MCIASAFSHLNSASDRAHSYDFCVLQLASALGNFDHLWTNRIRMLIFVFQCLAVLISIQHLYQDTGEDQIGRERTGGAQSTKTYKEWGSAGRKQRWQLLTDTYGVAVWPNVSTWIGTNQGQGQGHLWCHIFFSKWTWLGKLDLIAQSTIIANSDARRGRNCDRLKMHVTCRSGSVSVSRGRLVVKTTLLVFDKSRSASPAGAQHISVRLSVRLSARRGLQQFTEWTGVKRAPCHDLRATTIDH